MNTDIKRKRPAKAAVAGAAERSAAGLPPILERDAPVVLYEVIRRLRRGRWTITELPVRSLA